MQLADATRPTCALFRSTPARSLQCVRAPAIFKQARSSTRKTARADSQLIGESSPFRPRKRSDWEVGPSFELSQEQAVLTQLEALQRNNEPSVDHGIEVLYRFANFDPFARSTYFGVNRDLGQFERFRRIFHTPHYSILLSHVQHLPLSSLKAIAAIDSTVLVTKHKGCTQEQLMPMSCCMMQVSELQWKQRMWVKGYKAGEEGVFEFTMVQRLGGRYDGIWFTDQLTCDDCPSSSLSV